MSKTDTATMAPADLVAIYDALDKVQAIIEFDLDGTVVSANENFLRIFGYGVDEVVGRHHRIFCEPGYVESEAYTEFWKKLGRGELHAAEFKRLAKGGREIWLQASYNPVLNKDGEPIRVVKFATDVTAARLQNAEFEGKVQAIDRAQAAIEFDLDGTVISANENFLQAFGYRLDEVVGKHHRIFCEPGYAESDAYAEFWRKLGRGEYHAAEFKRLAKGGREIWLQASYNPIFDMDGKPFKVVKFATDVTAAKLQNAEFEGKVQAIDRAQAVIELELDGTVISANENFLQAFGYRLDEVVGKHHRIFCEPGYAESDAYAEFWRKLGRGEYHAAEFKRLAKGGREIWLQASYNPIFDMDGKPFKVVKFATDVTAAKLQNAEFEGKVQAIDRAQAVIELELDGTVISANENFLRIFGYRLDEVAGKHHRIFCDPGYAESPAYTEFWQKLGRGEYDADEFKRIGKDGTEIWLQASYNPIFDAEGRPRKIVKFAADITEEVQKRSLALLEMSTPVTKIWDGVLFAPIVGIVDSKRSVDIMNKALSSIADTRARTLLLDIGGVAVVDTAVANHLIKIAKAAVLMGCKTIISGISPSIAQTIAELGIDLGAIQTTSTIETALRDSIATSGAGGRATGG